MRRRLVSSPEADLLNSRESATGIAIDRTPLVRVDCAHGIPTISFIRGEARAVGRDLQHRCMTQIWQGRAGAERRESTKRPRRSSLEGSETALSLCDDYG